MLVFRQSTAHLRAHLYSLPRCTNFMAHSLLQVCSLLRPKHLTQGSESGSKASPAITKAYAPLAPQRGCGTSGSPPPAFLTEGKCRREEDVGLSNSTNLSVKPSGSNSSSSNGGSGPSAVPDWPSASPTGPAPSRQLLCQKSS